GVASQCSSRGLRSVNHVGKYLSSPRRMFLRNKHRDFWIAELGIFEVADAVFKGKLFGSHLVMNTVSAVNLSRMKWPGLDDIQHFQNHESLRHRGLLKDQIIPIACAEGLEPARHIKLQIVLC